MALNQNLHNIQKLVNYEKINPSTVNSVNFCFYFSIRYD